MGGGVEGGVGGLPPIDVCYTGLDLQSLDAARVAAEADPPAVSKLLEGRPFILHLARLAPVKGHVTALHAVKLAEQALADAGWGYAIVGDGPDAARLRAQATQLGLTDRVQFLGRRDGAELAWLLGHASLAVSTSLAEALPTAVIEAMASGVPMLASDIPPQRELVEPDAAGLLFETGNAEAMAAGLRAMVSDPAAWGRYAAGGRRARERFTLDAMAAAFEATLERAIAAKRG